MVSSKTSGDVVITIEREVRGAVAVLTLDNPERSMNVIDEQVFRDLRSQFDEISADSSISTIVFTSGKRGSFGAGADVNWLPELAARTDAAEFLTSIHTLMWDIVASRLTFVTALNGAAFGGALELALAGDAIVAVPSATLGLPEITLGLIPGGGGTQLLRRWVNTDTALDLLLTGKPLSAQKALEFGLVTAIADEDDLVEVAIAHATRRPRITETTQEALAAVEKRQPQTGAAARILDAITAGIEDGPVAGSATERAAFLELIPSPTAKALIHVFTAQADMRKRSKSSTPDVETLAVIGGGQMGSGIAATAVSLGLSAIVRDVTDEKLASAHDYLDRVLARVMPDRATERQPAWSGTTGWAGFAGAQAVIEAVFELPELKRDTLAAVSMEVAPDALIATNTSAIPVGSLAPAVQHPERFIGMHFFSPVDRMPLVELVPHTGTSAETIGRASGLARQLGKVPVVVADFPGFFTSRVYARWLVEGLRLLLDGVDPQLIEDAAKRAGFPVGPLQASDEATLDLVLKASVTQVAENVMTTRLDIAAVRAALEKLIAAGVEGKRLGKGFYLYEEGRRAGLNPQAANVIGATQATLDPDTVRDRLLLAFASECFLCWDDGTLCHPDDGDIASVLGIGFPRALGGPFHWADEVGLGWINDRSTALGLDAFPTGTRLPALRAGGTTFADEARRTTPASA